MNKSAKTNKICVVVPVHNRLELTKNFVNSFRKSSYKNYQIVIINDGSNDGTDEYLSSQKDIIELKGDGNLWWTGCTAKGVEYALENDFDYVLTINQDAEVDTDHLQKMVDCAEKKPNALIGNVILTDDGKTVWAAGVTSNWWYQFKPSEPGFSIFNHNYWQQPVTDLPDEAFSVEALNGDGVLIPIEVFRKVGNYNAKWTPQHHADTEFTLRAGRNGFDVLICPQARIINHAETRKSIKSSKDRILSKKSGLYWRAIVFSYISNAPVYLKWGFIIPYFYHFLQKLRLVK